MIPDVSNLEPIRCPTCEQELFLLQLKDDPNKAELGGCKCERKVYDLPDFMVLGVEGAPLFLFKEKKEIGPWIRAFRSHVPQSERFNRMTDMFDFQEAVKKLQNGGHTMEVMHGPRGVNAVIDGKTYSADEVINMAEDL